MSIKYWVEGPKASGKTTVLQSIANSVNDGKVANDQFSYHQKVQINHFGGHDATLQGSVLQQLQVSPTEYLVDRGYLSSIIYGWIGSVQPEFKIKQMFGQWQVTGWTQFEQNQFKLIIDHIKGNNGAYVIFYASNPVELINRTIERNSNMNNAELNELVQSNVMHHYWAEMLKDLYFDKYPIISWDISKQFVDNLLDNLPVLKKFFNYRSFKSFDWTRHPLFTALKNNSLDAETPNDLVTNADATADDYQHQLNRIEQWSQLEDIRLQQVTQRQIANQQLHDLLQRDSTLSFESFLGGVMDSAKQIAQSQKPVQQPDIPEIDVSDPYATTDKDGRKQYGYADDDIHHRAMFDPKTGDEK